MQWSMDLFCAVGIEPLPVVKTKNGGVFSALLEPA